MGKTKQGIPVFFTDEESLRMRAVKLAISGGATGPSIVPSAEEILIFLKKTS